MMESVREAVWQAKYQRGIALFGLLRSPEREDYRYVGIAYLNVGRLSEAELHLNQAISMGDSEAWTYLASVRMKEHRFSEAAECLQQVNPDELNAEERLCWYRERTRVGWMLGEPLPELKNYALMAWNEVSHVSPDLQAAIALLLGDLHVELGQPEAALEYLNFALMSGHQRRQEYVQLCRVNALIALKDFQAARNALDTIVSDDLALTKDLKSCEVYQAEGRWSEARKKLTSLLRRCAGWPSQEIKARILLLRDALIHGEDDSGAQRHCERLMAIAQCPLDKAEVQRLTGFWKLRQGNPDGFQLLQDAFQQFMWAGGIWKAISCQLMMAELRESERLNHLREALRLQPGYPAPPAFVQEWKLFTQLLDYLHALPEDALERQLLDQNEALLPKVEFLTLGTSMLLVNGKAVKLGLTKGPEILAYLLRNVSVPLADLQRELFPDWDKPRSRNYFQQLRSELPQRIPGLTIRYDEQEKLYQVNRPTCFTWDVEQLEESLAAGSWPQDVHFADFLPESDSDWVREERARLRRWITEVGLETMEGWYQAGEYQKCIYLAERLLPLDPLDEGLHTFLLNATFKMKGRAAANRQYRESAALFVQDIGEIPAALTRLQKQWEVLH